MIEINDPHKRAAELKRLGKNKFLDLQSYSKLINLLLVGHIEDHIYLYFRDNQIKSTVTHDELDEERTTPDGKTSAVHFRRFPFTQQQVLVLYCSRIANFTI